MYLASSSRLTTKNPIFIGAERSGSGVAARLLWVPVFEVIRAQGISPRQILALIDPLDQLPRLQLPCWHHLSSPWIPISEATMPAVQHIVRQHILRLC